MRGIFLIMFGCIIILTGCTNQSGSDNDTQTKEEGQDKSTASVETISEGHTYITEDGKSILKISDVTESYFQINLSLRGEADAYVQLEVEINESKGNELTGKVSDVFGSKDIVSINGEITLRKEKDKLFVELEGITKDPFLESDQDVEMVDRIKEKDIIPFIKKAETAAAEYMAEHFTGDPADLKFDIPFDELKQTLKDNFTEDYIHNNIESVYNDPGIFYEYTYVFPLANKGDIDTFIIEYTYSEILVFLEYDLYMEDVPAFYELIVDDGKWKINKQIGIKNTNFAAAIVKETLDLHSREWDIEVHHSNSFHDLVELYKNEGNFEVSVTKEGSSTPKAWFQVNTIDGKVYEWNRDNDRLLEVN